TPRTAASHGVRLPSASAKAIRPASVRSRTSAWPAERSWRRSGDLTSASTASKASSARRHHEAYAFVRAVCLSGSTALNWVTYHLYPIQTLGNHRLLFRCGAPRGQPGERFSKRKGGRMAENRKLRQLFVGGILGSLGALLLDPQQGRRRRARLADRTAGLARRTSRRAER